MRCPARTPFCAAAVMAMALPVALAYSARAQSPDVIDPAVDPAVTAAIDADGSARVLVVYTGADPVAASRAADEALATTRSNVTVRYRSIPVVGATIDAAGLDALADDPAVKAIYADEALGAADIAAPMAAAVDGGYGREAAGGANAPATARGDGWWVAVVDSGVDLTHPYLAGKGGTGHDGLGDAAACFSSGPVSGDGQGGCPGGGEIATGAGAAVPCTWRANKCGHGTHVAGIAAGSSAVASGYIPRDGAAPGAGIYPVQVFSGTPDNDAVVWTADLIGALEHIDAQRAHYRFAAVNISIVDFNPRAGYCDTAHPLRQLIARLAAAGVPVVAAAGNEGESGGVDSPACFPESVTASAADMTTSSTVVASFSNAHPEVTDLVAGGTMVVSSEPGGGYAYRSGTSMAAPAVAGAIAAARQLAPALDSAGIVELLTTSAQPVIDTRSGATYDRVDLGAAIAAIPGFVPTPPWKPEAAPGPAPVAAGFNAIPPVRVADSRTGTGIAGRLAAGGYAALSIASVAPGSGPPIAAIAANVTATGGSAAGYLTVWPCDQPRPTASSVNFTAGSTDPNAVAVGASASGNVCVYASAAVDVVVDVTGVFRGDGAGYQPVVPRRMLDTRTAVAPIDSAPRSIGLPGLPVDANAVTVNVTAVDPQGDGYVTIWPCGQPMPPTSSLNTVTGVDRPNLVTVGVGDGGAICAAASVPTDLVVDLQGWFEHGSPLRFVPGVPSRVADSRLSAGVDRLAAGTTEPVMVGGVPEGASVALNVTVTDPAGDGFLTVWPCGEAKPLASNVNYSAGQTIPNAVVSGVGSGGRVCVSSYAATDVVFDLTGAWTTP